MCERAVEDEPKALEHIPDCFKSKKMCEITVEDEPDTLEFVPGYLKTQEMCGKAVEKHSYMLEDVPDHFKTQKYVIRQLMIVHRCLVLSLIVLRPGRCVKKQLKNIYGY